MVREATAWWRRQIRGVCSRRSHTRTPVLCSPNPAGVTDIQTNVEAKTVVVQAEESVSPQLMLEKLQKVGSFFGCEEAKSFV